MQSGEGLTEQYQISMSLRDLNCAINVLKKRDLSLNIGPEARWSISFENRAGRLILENSRCNDF